MGKLLWNNNTKKFKNKWIIIIMKKKLKQMSYWDEMENKLN